MPEGDRKFWRKLDRVAGHVLDRAIARQSRDILARRLEPPDQAPGETSNERMLKVSFPPQIKCNSAVGQIEALDARTLTCERAFDFFFHPTRDGDGLGSGLLERLRYGSDLSAVRSGPAQSHIARAGPADDRRCVADAEAPTAVERN